MLPQIVSGCKLFTLSWFHSGLFHWTIKTRRVHQPPVTDGRTVASNNRDVFVKVPFSSEALGRHNLQVIFLRYSTLLNDRLEFLMSFQTFQVTVQVRWELWVSWRFLPNTTWRSRLCGRKSRCEGLLLCLVARASTTASHELRHGTFPRLGEVRHFERAT